MASIRRRRSKWQAQIRRQGHAPLSRTFHLKADAELWARQTEAELDRGGLPVDSRELRSHTLGDLLRRYANEVVPRKRGSDREVYLLRVILRHAITRVSLHRLTAADVAKYRDHRLSLVKADTVRRELAIVRHCIEVARNEWGFMLPSNPVRQVKLPRAGNPRERRVNPGELERLLAACETSRCRCLLYTDSDHKSGHVPNVMSALPPKADMCGANTDVRYGSFDDFVGATYQRHRDFFRFMMSSTFVACWIGRSAGFSPLSIRPTLFRQFDALRRCWRHNSSDHRSPQTREGGKSSVLYDLLPARRVCRAE
jgi:hypothetical protein